MTRNALRIACAVAFPLLSSGAALAAVPEGLKLTSGPVRTDPAGAFVSVGVANTTTTIFGQIVVTCTFTGGGQTLGTSSTTLFSVVGGTTGNDQVRLIGATSATAATCEITSAQ
ncbi:hypothetical protein [Xanthobacter agilis]|jgi:hypothetical protein|uniref:Uncharacterized protein n=1 Tax=Xanthobacter agilis TaxID=47492 RepID=A0ABU0L9K1_XANAG|nr:hypothetical protein [Xanthobacter agilis]MDQ0503791.1 hypothetical protein [Xanthobacter agilis]